MPNDLSGNLPQEPSAAGFLCGASEKTIAVYNIAQTNNIRQRYQNDDKFVLTNKRLIYEKKVNGKQGSNIIRQEIPLNKVGSVSYEMNINEAFKVGLPLILFIISSIMGLIVNLLLNNSTGTSGPSTGPEMAIISIISTLFWVPSFVILVIQSIKSSMSRIWITLLLFSDKIFYLLVGNIAPNLIIDNAKFSLFFEQTIICLIAVITIYSIRTGIFGMNKIKPISAIIFFDVIGIAVFKMSQAQEISILMMSFLALCIDICIFSILSQKLQFAFMLNIRGEVAPFAKIKQVSVISANNLKDTTNKRKKGRSKGRTVNTIDEMSAKALINNLGTAIQNSRQHSA